MHLPLSLSLLLSLITSVTSLQNIVVGRVQRSCGSSTIKGGQYIIYFSDSDKCTDSVVYGYPNYFVGLCGHDFTLLGHEGITFTGCYTPPYSYPRVSGVSDGGNPALTCVDVAPGEVTHCPNDCDPQNDRIIETLQRCS